MPDLEFTPIGAELRLGAGGWCEENAVVFHVKLQSDSSSFMLTTGERIEELQQLVCVTSKHEDPEPHELGKMYYIRGDDGPIFPYPPRVQITITLPQPKFAELIRAARAGKLPSTIEVVVNEIETWTPGLSPKQWDNKDVPEMHVHGVRISLPLVPVIEAGEDDLPDWRRPPEEMPVNREQMERLISVVQKLLVPIFWAIVIVGIANAIISW